MMSEPTVLAYSTPAVIQYCWADKYKKREQDYH